MESEKKRVAPDVVAPDVKKQKISNESVDHTVKAFFPSADQQHAINQLVSEGKLIDIGLPGMPIHVTPRDWCPSFEDALKQLMSTGVTAVRVIPADKISHFQKYLCKEVSTYGGFLPQAEADASSAPSKAFGTSGLHGHPGSFHNETTRALRMKASRVAKKLMESVVKSAGLENTLKFQTLFDRVMTRAAGKAPSGESWHRDVADKHTMVDGDMLFGGWINITDEPQRFCFIAGSHLGVNPYTIASGFASVDAYVKKNKISAEDAKALSERLESYATTVCVRPGHMIIFPQYIMHCVLGKSVNHMQCRLFTGWRLTSSDKSVYISKTDGSDYLNTIIDDQGVPPLPSSGDSIMYDANHLRFHKPALLKFSEQFEPRLLVNGIVPRVFPSLKAAGLPMYPPYLPAERAIFSSQSLAGASASNEDDDTDDE